MSRATKVWWPAAGAGALGFLFGAFLFGPQAADAAGVPGLVLMGLLVAAVAFAVAAAGLLSRLRREESFAAFAKEQGWVHLAAVKGGPFEAFRTSLPFTQGHSPRADNLLQGRYGGRPFLYADAQYTTGSGKSSQTHAVAAVAVPTPFPLSLTIERETFGHKVADTFGGEDIDVESDEFSRLFWVKSSDRRLAYGVLHPRAIEFLLGAGTDWTWHWNGSTLVMARLAREPPSASIVYLRQANAFLDLVPRHLLPDGAGAPPPARPPGPPPAGKGPARPAAGPLKLK
jgi:hypothetical protein